MPNAAAKGNQSTTNFSATIPVQSGPRTSAPTEAVPASGKAQGTSIGEQESALGETSKSASTSSKGTDISSMISGSHGAGALAGAGARVTEAGAAGRVELAPVIQKVWEAAESLPSSPSGRIDLNVPLSGNENVKIRVEMRSGEIHATLQTDSPELREALRKSWPDFVVQSNDRGLRLGEANFSSTQQDGAGSQSGAGSNREQLFEQQAEGQQNSTQQRSGGVPASTGRLAQSGSANVVAPATKAPAPDGPVTLWA